MAQDKIKKTGKDKKGSEMTEKELIAFARSYVYKPEGAEAGSGKDGRKKGQADRQKISENGKAVRSKAGESGKAVRSKVGESGKADRRKAGESGKAVRSKVREDGRAPMDKPAPPDRPLRQRDLPPIDENAPQCPVSKRCGGCTFIGRSYAASLACKRERVEKLLAPFGKLSGMIGMENPYHYRNKVHAVFAHVKDGRKERNYAGIYEAGTHKVVPVTRCLIENEEADAIIQDILELARSFKIKIFDEDTGYGLLRHVLVRIGHATGQIMVVLVLSSPILPGKNSFVKALRTRHPAITTILINVNGEQTSMVLGDRETVLFGPGYIEDELCGNRFRISSRSFYQVNSVQTEKLYRKAVSLANLTGQERVIDAYCGIGTIGITAAAGAKEVIGVELNPDAVKDAIRNAKANHIDNIFFYENDAGDFLNGMAAQRERADVIFMDPPRAGSTQQFMDAAAAMSPKRIVYISCEPDTLARDLAYLKGKGYVLKEAWGFDMFPFTENVEVCCLLSRKI